MISITEAQCTILDHVAILDRAELPLMQSLGKVLAEDVVANWDILTADNSAMDGFAFASQPLPCENLKVVDFILLALMTTNGYFQVAPAEAHNSDGEIDVVHLASGLIGGQNG